MVSTLLNWAGSETVRRLQQVKAKLFDSQEFTLDSNPKWGTGRLAKVFIPNVAETFVQ